MVKHVGLFILFIILILAGCHGGTVDTMGVVGGIDNVIVPTPANNIPVYDEELKAVVLENPVLSADTVKLTWSMSKAKDFYSYRICRSIYPNVINYDGNVIMNIANRELTSFTSKVPDTNKRYYYKVFVIDSKGTSLASKEFWAITGENLFGESETTGDITFVISVTKRTPTTITLSWNKFPVNGFNYYKLFKSTSADVSTTDGLDIVTIENHDLTSFTIYKLTANTKYYFKMKAVYSNSLSSLSNELEASTTEKEIDDSYLNPKIAIILPPIQYNEVEYTGIKNYFIQKSFQVFTASTVDDEAIGNSGTKIDPDYKIENLDISSYKALFIIGGSGTASYLWSDSKLHQKLNEAAAKFVYIAAIGSAPVAVGKAGLLHGKTATVINNSSLNTIGELQNTGAKYSSETLVEAGRIVTATDETKTQALCEKLDEYI